MEPELSSLALPSLVEHMQSDLALIRQRITEAGPLSVADRVAAAQHIRILAATLGNLHQVIGPTPSGNTVEGEVMATPDLKVRSHSCECMCETCERTGAGYFAQHQALAGNSAAAQHLSPTIYAWLTAQRAERLALERKKVAA